MNTFNVKAFRRDMNLRPYKQAFRTLKQFGSSLLIAGVAVVGGWIVIIGFWAVFA